MATNGFDTASTAANQQVNALYLGLFDRPADPSGQAYWANQAGTGAAIPSTAVDAMGTFATYDNTGVAISAANINSEIVSIYANLFGDIVTTTNPGVAYWAAQFNAGQSIGQIVNSIYNIVENLHSGSTNYLFTETMNAKIGAANQISTYYLATGTTPATASGYAGATSLINNGYTMANYSSLPSSMSTSSQNMTASAANNTLIGGIGADTLNLTAAPATGVTYSFIGGIGANAIDVNYAGVTAADLTQYLGSASGFQTLDFTVSATPGALDLSKVDHSGFTTVDLNGGTFVFQNAGGSADNFNVNANTTSLTISDATGHTGTTVDLNGGSTGFTLGTLDTNVPTSAATSTAIALPNTVNPTTVDIVSNGTAANTISALDLVNGSTVNITGSDSLAITAVTGNNITYNYSGFTGTTLTVDGVNVAPVTTTASNGLTTTAINIIPGSTTTWADLNYNFTIGNSVASTTLTAGNGIDTVTINGTAGTGAETITLGTGNDTVISTGTGSDTIVLGGATVSTGFDQIGGTVSSSNVLATSLAGNNSITISGGSGTDTIWVGQGNNTIALGGTTGTDNISIGQGANTITLGSGADTLNLTTAYNTVSGTTGYGLAGANTLKLNGASAATATLVFNHSADTVAPTFIVGTAGNTTYTTTTAATFGTTALSISSVAAEITTLQGVDAAVAGDTSVVWATTGNGNQYVIMDHSLTTTTYVDQVIQIAGAATYLAGDAVTVNSTTHLVNVVL
ncbi:MAG: hypothetical protein ACYCTB_03485 [bacterium]